MNKIVVETDLVPHALAEIIPGVTIQQQLGETIHVKIEIGPVEVKHNHLTRDIKTRGRCPACDRYLDSEDQSGTGQVPDQLSDGS